MNLNITGPSFTGFSDNLNVALNKSSDAEAAFVAVKMDNVGNPDLEEFKNLKRECGFNPQDIENDIFVMTKVKNPQYGEFYTFDGLEVPKPEQIANPHQRAMSVKIYEYMQGIAERLSKSENLKETEGGLDNVIMHAYNEIKRVSRIPQIALSMVTKACDMHQPLNETAKIFSEDFKRILGNIK